MFGKMLKRQVPPRGRAHLADARIAREAEVYYDAARMTRVQLQEHAAESESAQKAERDAAGFLWDFWYPAARSSEIRGRNLAKAMLLEVPLVLGRTDDGKSFAMRDACPHRGIPLSYGRFDGKSVECSYHGWKFGWVQRAVRGNSFTDQPGQAESSGE